LIAGFIAVPQRFDEQVRRGQNWLGGRTAIAFRDRMAEILALHSGCIR
jgi:hypothetical protein